MVSGTSTTEFVLQVGAKRIWNALVKDGHNFIPKIFPDIFTSVTLLQGDGGVGTIKQLNFNPAGRDFTFVKERVDEVDDENLVYKYTLIEGGLLGSRVSSANFEVKYIPRTEGGSVVSWTSHYETLPGIPLDDGRIKEIVENLRVELKKVDEYLVSNPNLYT